VTDDPFAGRAAWFDAHYATGRGRIRLDLVMERLLRELPPPPASVLDAGGGTGAFALPLAERGYHVTLLDRSPEWLALGAARARDRGLEAKFVEGPAEAAPDLVDGPFDAVLLHTVLIYAADPEVTLGAVRRVALEGAVLSCLEKNRLALPVRPALQGEFEEARRVLNDPVAAGRLGIPNRAFEPGQLRAMLLRTRWVPRSWAGIRVFTDLLPDDASEETLMAGLDLERRVLGRDPYRALGRLLHVLAVAAGPDAPLGAVQARSHRAALPATRTAWPPERAMEPSRLESFLREPRYAVLTTGRPDGRPHAAVVAFVLHDGRLWLPAVSGAVRVRNAQHEPFASLAIFDGAGDDHRAVLVEGHAIVHDRPRDVRDLLEAFLHRAWRTTYGTELGWAGAVIELIPARVLSYQAPGAPA
jgi:S-adenosylmethionine-dependent methyltransferase